MLIQSDFEDYGFTQKDAYRLFRIIRAHASSLKTENVRKSFMFKGKMIEGLVSQTSITFTDAESVINRLKEIKHYRFDSKNVDSIQEVLTYKINKTLSE